MKCALDHHQMKAVDTWSIQKMGIPSLVLMERASLAVAGHLRDRIDKQARILAVSGTGNNGADAVAAGRILYNEGYKVDIGLFSENDRISEELKVQVNIARNLGMTVYTLDEVTWNDYDWLIDGLFGIGLSRPVEGAYADVIENMNVSKARICSVDIPSGIFADNGQILGRACKSDLTVSFGYDKIGMLLYPGAAYIGDLYVEDIGFAANGLKNIGPYVFSLERSDVKKHLPPRFAWSNKGNYGKLLVIAGTKNMAGAACLCAKAGYAAGTGLVKLMTPEVNREIVQTLVPEAVLYTYEPEELTEAQVDAQIAWADAIVIGPGLGKGREVEMMLRCLLNQKKPVLIDADGLNVLAEHRTLLLEHKGQVVVTPHLGEMSRLTGESIFSLKSDPLIACKTFADAYHVICVMKDARTLISNGDLVWINTSGNEGMSTGGSGDVLSGIIGGLMAQSDEENLGLISALGVMIHGLSGDEAKRNKGTYGLLASDIIQYMSEVIR